MSVRDAATLTPRVQEGGQVRYELPGAGTLTIGHDPREYPAHGARLTVTLAGPAGRGTLRLYGVQLLGTRRYQAADALDALQPAPSGTDYVCTLWLRMTRTPTDHRAIPARTHQRLAYLVATATREYLHRPDAPALRAAHDRHHAPARARRHQLAIARLDHEIAALAKRIAAERTMLAAQEAIAATRTHHTTVGAMH